MAQNAPTVADRAKGISKSSPKRPNSLTSKTKTKLKRHEVSELAEINFVPQKLVGAAKMKSRSIDNNCKTRQDILQLYEKLRKVDFVCNIRFYESDFKTLFF